MSTRRTHEPGEADVVVVGAGAAGAAAALEVLAGGRTVLGVDAAGTFGGTALYSGAGACVAGSPLQRAQGIRDDADTASRELLDGQEDASRPWARFYFARAVDEVYGWLEQRGVVWDHVMHCEGNSVPRRHVPRGGGAAVMGSLWRGLQGAGPRSRWLLGHTATDLLRDGRRVVGVRVARPDGLTSELRGSAVVMATGGFAGNLSRVLLHAPRLRAAGRVLAGGGAGARGTGHDVLAAHGADFANLEQVCTYAYATPDPRDPLGERGLVVRGVTDWIWVDAAARRFHDESRADAGLSATDALLALRPATAWALMDARAAESLHAPDQYAAVGTGGRADAARMLLEESPDVLRCDTVEELAARSGLPAVALAETLHGWNALLASGAARDPLTGRELAGLRPLGRPLVAVRLLPLARKNLGGVRTDLRCRVLDRSGGVVPGLYAAGELAGLAGGHIAGSNPMEGIMFGASVFSGRVAGAWAAAESGARMPRGLAAGDPGATGAAQAPAVSTSTSAGRPVRTTSSASASAARASCGEDTGPAAQTP